MPSEVENLSVTDRYNEAVMTGLRTVWGVSLKKITEDFGENYVAYLLKQAKKYLEKELLIITDEASGKTLKATQKGKFLTDGIASDLFIIDEIFGTYTMTVLDNGIFGGEVWFKVLKIFFC